MNRLEEEKRRKANMTEVAFAKTFLTTLDSKPAKYQANHVFDPEKFGLRYPVGITFYRTETAQY